MPKIAILTDSTANLPEEWVKQYNVSVIPLKVIWGDQTFLDGVDLSPKEFYERLTKSKTIPTTSQPSIQDFLTAYESLADNADCIVVPLISSGISGTVSSAQAAARQFTRVPVEIIDTHITSMGQVLIILAIARAFEQGKSVEEVKLLADYIIHNLRTYFAVDTLEYLHRGGRINGAARYFGMALNIKPILYFNPEGKIDALERVRTSRKALERLISLTGETAAGQPAHIGIVHANAPDVVREFRKEVEARVKIAEIFTLDLSPVIGIHVGPGTIGIGVYTDPHD